MYDHILVPVSFDDDRNASQAVRVARHLLAPGGKVTLLHVMEKLPAYAVNYVPEGFHEQTKDALIAAMHDMASDFDQAACYVEEGHPARTIMDCAAQHGADCIVIASHRPGLSDYLLGGTAAFVVRHAPCSVHVLR